MEQKILDFIQRRFSTDCNWLDGNCYYFALILNDRFYPECHGECDIVYDLVDGHFMFKCENKYFDYSGLREDVKEENLISWYDFIVYDAARYTRVIHDCLL